MKVKDFILETLSLSYVFISYLVMSLIFEIYSLKEKKRKKKEEKFINDNL